MECHIKKLFSSGLRDFTFIKNRRYKFSNRDQKERSVDLHIQIMQDTKLHRLRNLREAWSVVAENFINKCETRYCSSSLATTTIFDLFNNI